MPALARWPDPRSAPCRPGRRRPASCRPAPPPAPPPASLCPVKVARSRPLAGSQIRTVPVPARRRPASCRPAPPPAPPPRRSCPVKVARSRPLAGSQIRTVPSPPAEASQLPSGATASAATAPPESLASCPVMVARSRPLAGSQIRTVPSSPAEASQLPSGATASAATRRQCLVPGQGGAFPAAGRIPDPHRAVQAGGGQPAAVRRHRQRRHPAACRARSRWRAPGRWPDPRSAPCRPSRRRPASCRPAPPPAPPPA